MESGWGNLHAVLGSSLLCMGLSYFTFPLPAISSYFDDDTICVASTLLCQPVSTRPRFPYSLLDSHKAGIHVFLIWTLVPTYFLCCCNIACRFLGKETDVEGRPLNLKLGKDLFGHLFKYLFLSLKIEITPNLQSCEDSINNMCENEYCIPETNIMLYVDSTGLKK